MKSVKWSKQKTWSEVKPMMTEDKTQISVVPIIQIHKKGFLQDEMGQNNIAKAGWEHDNEVKIASAAVGRSAQMTEKKSEEEEGESWFSTAPH